MDSPSTDQDRKHLLLYLSGELGPGESEALEQRLFTDDEFSAEVMEIWNELTEAFASGQLPDDDRTHFEKLLAEHPERQYALQFAQSLHNALKSPKARGETSSRARIRSSHLAWVLTAAAAAALVFYFATIRRPAVSPAAAPHSTASQPVAPSAVLLLGVGITRGVSQIPSVVLPPNAQALEIEILLEPLPGQNVFTALVEPPKGSPVPFPNLHIEKMGADSFLKFRISASTLSSGTYTFSIYDQNRPGILILRYKGKVTR